MDLKSLLVSLFLGANGQGAAVQPTATAKPAPVEKPAAGATSGAAQPASADDVVGKVQSYYTATKQLTAKFSQTTLNDAFGRVTVSAGKVYIKKPGKMRWDYVSKKDKNKVTKSFMSDGTTMWAAMDMQFYKKSVKDDLLPVAITFLSGKGDLRTDFVAKLDTTGTRGGKDDLVLALEPKKPSAAYKALWLVVDPKDYRVKQSIIKSSSGDSTTYAFYEPDTKKAVSDTWFVFNEDKMKAAGYREIKPEDFEKKKKDK